ncbi:hypothetical protein PCE1_003433 [Barthelona sp. PCE]
MTESPKSGGEVQEPQRRPVNPTPLDDFDIVPQPIGRGAFGVVYRATRRRDGLSCVLKEIPIGNASKREISALQNEITVMHKIRCPYVVRYYGHFCQNRKLYIIMEYCSKGDLDGIIKRQIEKKQLFREDVVLKWLVQLLQGLKVIHRSNIIHRDLKPSNIMVDSDGNLKIGDMGLGRILNSSTQFAKTFCGTPLYFSPELCNGDPYNTKSDVWSLGVILYELMTLSVPFKASNQMILIQMILRRTPAPLGDCYSKAVQFIVQCMLDKDPSTRPTVTDVLNFPVMMHAMSLLKLDFQRRQHELNVMVLDEQQKRLRVENNELALKLIEFEQRARQYSPLMDQLKKLKLNASVEREMYDKEREVIKREKQHLLDENQKLKALLQESRETNAENVEEALERLRKSYDRLKRNATTVHRNNRILAEHKARLEAEVLDKKKEIAELKALHENEIETFRVNIEELEIQLNFERNKPKHLSSSGGGSVLFPNPKEKEVFETSFVTICSSHFGLDGNPMDLEVFYQWENQECAWDNSEHQKLIRPVLGCVILWKTAAYSTDRPVLKVRMTGSTSYVEIDAVPMRMLGENFFFLTLSAETCPNDISHFALTFDDPSVIKEVIVLNIESILVQNSVELSIFSVPSSDSSYSHPNAEHQYAFPEY